MVDGRGPGTSVEYRGLQAGLRDDLRIGAPVNRTNYQDLDDTHQAEKYQYLVAEGASEVKTKNIVCQIIFTLDSFYVYFIF